MVPTKLPEEYINIINTDNRLNLPEDPKEINEEIKQYLPWNRRIINQPYTFIDIIKILKKTYKFERLPESYFYVSIPLPEHPEQVGLTNGFTLPITRIEDIKQLTKVLRQKYTFDTRNLSNKWIDLQADKRTLLPMNINEINRTANVNLPINKDQIIETAKKMREFYKFDRIPDEWIQDSYTPRPELPTIDKTILEMAIKTTQTIILPIVERNKIYETVRTLHKYYNFDKLPKEFFRIPESIHNPILVFPENQFAL
jgi:hypothetical protein